MLEPIFEADFEENAHAYRPGRSAHDALAEIQKRLYGGQGHVVDADVTKYFDTIPHAELMQSVARRVADGKILRLLKLWLKSPVEERDERGNRRMTGGKKSKCGTPQGGVVSPLLANIYINRLLPLEEDWGVRGWDRSFPTPTTSSSSARARVRPKKV